MCFLKFSATSLKWHWLPGVSRWLVRVIPYSTLSCSTQSYRVRLRAVIFSHMDVIYRNVDVIYTETCVAIQRFYVQLYQETTSKSNQTHLKTWILLSSAVSIFFCTGMPIYIAHVWDGSKNYRRRA